MCWCEEDGCPECQGTWLGGQCLCHQKSSREKAGESWPGLQFGLHRPVRPGYYERTYGGDWPEDP